MLLICINNLLHWFSRLQLYLACWLTIVSTSHELDQENNIYAEGKSRYGADF